MERGYHGKEVNLAVMLCLLEKKTGLLYVNYVCVRVRRYLYFSLCMSLRLRHHLPRHHRIRVCNAWTFCYRNPIIFQSTPSYPQSWINKDSHKQFGVFVRVAH